MNVTAMKRMAKWASAALLVGGVAAGASDEGTRRSVAFWRTAGPAYAHYRFTQWRLRGVPEAEAEREWQRLHDLHAPRVKKAILELKGFYLKSAQIMSMQDSFMPAQYLEVCKQMQDRVPTDFQPGQARALIEAQLPPGRAFDDVFAEFDDTPIGAASIGQVHRARLRDGRTSPSRSSTPASSASSAPTSPPPSSSATWP